MEAFHMKEQSIKTGVQSTAFSIQANNLRAHQECGHIKL